MTADEVNALSINAFVARFGFLFEHSPWIVAAAADRRPFVNRAAMLAALEAVVADADEAAQLALLRAHPELAGSAEAALTEASAAEQASAGLDRLAEAEFAEFHRLNDAYRATFGFPFIVCVRLTGKAGILSAMRTRLGHDRAKEFAAARAEIAKIVRLRLAEVWP